MAQAEPLAPDDAPAGPDAGKARADRRPAGSGSRRRAHHRSRRARRQLAHAHPPDAAGGMRGRGQGRRLWLRHRAGRQGAHPRRLQDLLRRRPRRGAARAHGGARGGDLRAQRADAGHGRGLCRHQRAAGDRQPAGARRMGRLRRRQPMARRRGAARRHRHEPARRHGQRSGGAGAAHPRREPRHHAADEPPRLRASAGASAQPAPDRSLPRRAHALPRHPVVARQFLRHLSQRRRPLRRGAAGGGALWRQPDAGTRQSDEAGGRPAGAHRAGAPRAARRDRRLRRHLDRAPREPHRGGGGRLWRRLSARGRLPRIRRRAATPSSPASAARSPGAFPWT